YHESAVAEAVKAICSEHRLACRSDRYGNLIVSLQTDRRVRPLALAAHMDHPGFEIERRLTASSWLARFHGGVGNAWFVPGTKIRLMSGAMRARLGRRVGKDKVFEVETTARPSKGNGDTLEKD